MVRRSLNPEKSNNTCKKIYNAIYGSLNIFSRKSKKILFWNFQYGERKQDAVLYDEIKNKFIENTDWKSTERQPWKNKKTRSNDSIVFLSDVFQEWLSILLCSAHIHYSCNQYGCNDNANSDESGRNANHSHYLVQCKTYY